MFIPTSNSSDLLLLLWLFSWSWLVIYDTKMWKQNYKIRQDFALCEPDKLKCFKWVDRKQTEELCNGQKETSEDAHVWKGVFFETVTDREVGFRFTTLVNPMNEQTCLLRSFHSIFLEFQHTKLQYQKI